MKKRGFTAEQIIDKLREVEFLPSQWATVLEVSRKLGITEQTPYRWRKEYGGMRVEQALRLKELEKEKEIGALSLVQEIFSKRLRTSSLSGVISRIFLYSLLASLHFF